MDLTPLRIPHFVSEWMKPLAINLVKIVRDYLQKRQPQDAHGSKETIEMLKALQSSKTKENVLILMPFGGAAKVTSDGETFIVVINDTLPLCKALADDPTMATNPYQLLSFLKQLKQHQTCIIRLEDLQQVEEQKKQSKRTPKLASPSDPDQHKLVPPRGDALKQPRDERSKHET